MTKTAPSIADEAIQEEILQVALGLYRKLGPDKVTMDDVAHASGRSRTSLYYYYKNRDEIFQAVLDSIVRDVIEEIRQAAHAGETVDDKVYAFCATKLRTSEKWKTIFKAMHQSISAAEKSKYNNGMNSLHKKLIYQESLIISEILNGAMAKNEIPAISIADQDMLAFIVSSGIRGIRNEILDQNDPHDVKAAVRLLADMVIKWLKG